MRLVFNVTTLEKHILSLVTYKHYKCMCGTIYVCVSPVSLLVCIFSHVFKRVLKVKHPNCMQVAIYMGASPVSLLACIFSRVLSLALKQHASFRKNANEMNVSLMHACVKFRLSYTVYSYILYFYFD